MHNISAKLLDKIADLEPNEIREIGDTDESLNELYSPKRISQDGETLKLHTLNSSRKDLMALSNTISPMSRGLPLSL